MKLKKTSRGFNYIEFKDLYNKKCTLQKSSLATRDAIWFGVDNTGPDMGENANKNVDYGRMHLTQKQVEELLPYLNQFIKTGEI